MNDKEQFEKNELLSGYIDNQLSPRQVTEFKRLLNHNPQMQQELEALERQKQLLRTLPVESAPAELAGDIKAVLERRFILHHSARQFAPVGQWRLRLRRVAAVAALVLIPLLALGMVVYTIIKPSGLESGPVLVTDSPTISVNDQPQTSDSDFAANYTPVLQFHTRQPIAAADFIEKKIHTLGLMNFATGQRESDRASFKITCSRQYIAELIGQMRELWPLCDKTTYALLSKDALQPVVQVGKIELPQMLEMLQLNDVSEAVRMASVISEKNALTPPAAGIDQSFPQSPLDQPLQPFLAWNENTQPAPKENADTQDTMSFVIEVLGL
jgi:hypothetical protein